VTTGTPACEAADPFDLPDWLGERAVTWVAESGLRDHPLVAGRLVADGEEPLDCDLLAVDEAYPAPVADDAARRLAHQAWRHGQVELAEREGRLTLLVPGTRVEPGLVLETLGRLAKAVGAPSGRYAAHLVVDG
jgi:hypothetical protein